MYICNSCGMMIPEEDLAYEVEDPSPRGVGLPAGTESFAVCPACGSDDIEELETCPICGNTLLTKDKLCCERCEQMLKREWENLVDKIYNEGYGTSKSQIAETIAELI